LSDTAIARVYWPFVPLDVALFMELAGSSAEEIAGARAHPVWSTLERIAHTLAYDAKVLGTRQPPLKRFARIHQPVLVATGGGIPRSKLRPTRSRMRSPAPSEKCSKVRATSWTQP
jgi:hypothetical protein